MPTGKRTTDFTLAAALDEIVGNVTLNGRKRTRRQTTGALATQLLGSGAIADVVAELQEGITTATDLAIAGVKPPKQSVRVLITTNTAYASITNGATLDGVVVATGDRIGRAYNGATGDALNGIVVVQASGAAIRATDMDTSDEIRGSVFSVDAGTHAGEEYAVQNTAAITVGTTPVVIQKSGASNSYAAEVIAARGPQASVDARFDPIEAEQVREHETRVELRKRALPRILWVGDSQFNNAFSTNLAGTAFSHKPLGECGLAFESHPYFDYDTWHDATFNPQTWAAGANQGRSSGQMGGGAYGVVTLSSTGPADGNTVTINGRVYTFKSALTGAADEVLIGATLRLSAKHLAAAVNATRSGIGIQYGEGTVANAHALAEPDGATCVLVAIVSGTAGNAYTLAKSGTNIALSGATFTAGIADTALCAQTWFGSVELTAYTGVVFNLGVNDIWLAGAQRPTAAITLDGRRLIKRCVAAGAWVLIGCPRPVDTSVANFGLGSVRRAKLIDLRLKLQALVEEEFAPAGAPVEFWDTHTATLGEAGDAAFDKAKSTSTTDGLHLSVLASHNSEADLRARHLERRVPRAPLATPDFWFRNVLPYALWDAAGGSGTTNYTGDVPLHWQVDWVSTSDTNMNVVGSLIANGDGSFDHQTVFTPASSGNPSALALTVDPFSAAMPSGLVGKWCRASVWVTASVWASWIGWELNFAHRDADDAVSRVAGSPRQRGVFGETPGDVLPLRAFSKPLVTSAFIMPADRTLINFSLTSYMRSDAGGAGTVRWSQPRFGECPDPRKFWGSAG